MNWFRSFHRPRPARRPIRLTVTDLEVRTVPAIVVNGTNAADVITSNYAFDPAAGQYRGNIVVNGKTAYSFLGDVYNDSIYLPDALQVNGLGGNDLINLVKLRDPATQDKPVTIHGGAGNDTIVGSSGHDSVYGDAGADSLNGYVDEDTLFADDADVGLVGGGGIDLLTFTSFSGTLRATPDFIAMNGNKLTAASGKFLQIAAFDVTGSNTADAIDLDQFPTFFATVRGMGGADVIRVNASRGLLDGGNGDDTIVNVSTREDSMTILGGNGNDTIRVSAGLTTIDGGAGDDDIDGRTVVPNYLNAGITVTGGSGNDTIRGSDLPDSLDGGAGNDTIVGGKGGDVLVGGTGRDSLAGGAGDDTFIADADDTRWAFGGGVDSLFVDDVHTAVIANAQVTINGAVVGVGRVESVSMTGTAGNDTLDASTFAGFVSLDGRAGNDTIRAGSGGSYLYGDEGNDKLFGGAGSDQITPGNGADQVAAGAGADFASIDLADTLVSMGDGNDSIQFEVTGQTVVLTDTKLTVNGKAYPVPVAETVFVVIAGTDGNDDIDTTGYTPGVSVTAYLGDDLIRTGPGPDGVDGGGGNDTIRTGGGDDFISSGNLIGTGNDDIDAGEGNNFVSAADGNDTIVAGSGNDTLYGGADDDTIRAGGGDDLVYGDEIGFHVPDYLPGNDDIDAGAGNDTVYGGAGNDVIRGGAGNDALWGYYVLPDADFDGVPDVDGNDTVDGGDDDDYVLGDAGADQLLGGAGNDRVTADTTDTLLDGGAGIDSFFVPGGHTITVTDTALVLNGVSISATGIEKYLFEATDGDDTLDASAYTGSITYRGFGGNDFIQGGAGNDTLSGEDGNDTILGGAGVDTLLGGAGADTFHADADPAVAAQEQALWDFNPDEGDVVV